MPRIIIHSHSSATRAPLALIDHSWAADKRLLGLRVRLQSLVSARTRIEVVTEGVFTRMILDDPSLEGVAAVLFDEFHERSLDADLGRWRSTRRRPCARTCGFW